MQYFENEKRDSLWHKKGETMSNNDILSALSEIECALYYRKDGSDNSEGVSAENIEKAHKAARDLLEFWHDITGEILK